MGNPGTTLRYSNNPVGFKLDGRDFHRRRRTATTTGLYGRVWAKGFQISAPADMATRTLRVYVGAWRAQARIVAPN